MLRVIKLTILLPALFLALFFPGNAFAETKTLNVTTDTYANEAYPDKANGSVGSVIISNKYTTRLGYLLFPDPDLPEEAIIDQANLIINVHEVHYANTAKVNVGPVTENWTETSVTFNSKPAINQTQAIESTLNIADTGEKTIVITDLVKKWQDGSLDNYGLFIYPFGYLYGSAETEYAISFKSIESGGQLARIEIEYHLESEATHTLEPTVTQQPLPETDTTISPTIETVSPTLEPTITPEPETTTEAQEKGGLVLNLTTGQTIIGSLILLALVGSVAAFATYFAKQSRQPSEKNTENHEDAPESDEE